MFVIRKKLTPEEGDPPATRYDETCECVQSTFDNGETWVDNPAQDPRTSPAFLTPESKVACDAAQGVSNMVRDFIDHTYTAFNVVGITSTALSIGLLFIPQIALLWKIAQIVAEGIVGVGSVTLAATFTEDVYDQIRDIAFCYLNEEGKFNDQAAFDEFGEALQEEIGGSAFNIVMALLFNLYGWVGFSNAGIKYGEPADCSGVNCGCTVVFDFLESDCDFFSVNYGSPYYDPWTWTAGVGWVQGGGRAEAWLKSPDFPPGITATEVRVRGEIAGTTVGTLEVFNVVTGRTYTSGTILDDYPIDALSGETLNNYIQQTSSHSSAATFILTRIEIDWDYCP